MNNARVFELLGDNLFVILSVLGTIVIIGYLWAKFWSKERGRYK